MTAVFAYFLDLLRDALPWFVGGALLGAALETWLPAAWVLRWLGSHRASVLNAAVAGALLPGCSMTTVPLAAALRSQGARLGTLTAFIMISPILSPETVTLTATMLGWKFALARVVVPVLAALALGLVINAAEARRLPTFRLPSGATPVPAAPGCGLPKNAMKNLSFLLLGLLTVSPARRAAAEALSLSRCQQIALAANPNFPVIEARLRAAEAGASQARRWPNPTLAVTALSNERDAALTQNFDVWGKLALAGRAALSEADLQRARRALAEREVLGEVAMNFWRSVSADRLAGLREQEAADWSELLHIREEEIAAGALASADLLVVRQSVAERRQAREALRLDRTSARAALNTLMGRSAQAPLSLDPAADSVALPVSDPAGAVRLALARHPLLAQARARLTQAGYRIEQERRRWLPDLIAGPALKDDTSNGGGIYAGAEVSFSLPVWNQNAAGITAARYEKAALGGELQAAEQEVARETFVAFQQWASAGRLLHDARTRILPTTEEQFARAEKGLAAGDLSRREFLAVRIERSRRRQDAETFILQREIAAAKLAQAVGTFSVSADKNAR